MKAAALFKVLTSFNLTSRGVTAYGHILEGKILPGYSAIVSINGQLAKVKITGTGMGRQDESGNTPWGLILQFEREALEKIAVSDRIKEQTIAIFKEIIPIQDLGSILYELQHLLNGRNYQVLLGVEIFNHCNNLEQMKIKLKDKFPTSRPDLMVPIPVSVYDLLKEIEFALEYRGDSTAGVTLSEPQHRQFLLLKASYVNFLMENIKPDSVAYSYPDDLGIPGYPVFWDQVVR